MSELLAGFIAALLAGLWCSRRMTRLAHRLREAEEGREAVSRQVGMLATQGHQATAILERMAEGVLAVDAQGRLLLMNPAAAALLGITTTDAIGRSLFEVARQQDLQELVRGMLRAPQPVSREVMVFHPSERMLRLHGVPCPPGPGEADGPSAGIVIQDVPEHHRYDQLRKEFVANVSHELKSPLTSIRSLTETLLGGALEDRASNRKFVGMIDEDAARLSHLIDDLLALSQIESQAVAPALTAVPLAPLVESVMAGLQPAIRQRGIAVAIDLPGDLAVQADPDRLRQVIANLLDNAVKYNRDNGRLTVSAARSDGWATVAVADTGIGIPPQDLPRIFERFYRVDKARSRAMGGTGLGLSIVKHTVESLGGTVSVQSDFDRGSTFSFTLRLA